MRSITQRRPDENRLLIDQTEENFDRVFDVNVKALFLLLREEVNQMLAQGQGGSIVNAASVSGMLAIPTAGHYVASKHAVLGLTKTAAIEYGKNGIRVNAVSPAQCILKCCSTCLGAKRQLTGWARLIPWAGLDGRKR